MKRKYGNVACISASAEIGEIIAGERGDNTCARQPVDRAPAPSARGDVVVPAIGGISWHFAQ